MRKFTQKSIKEAAEHLRKIRQLVTQRRSPFAGMTEEQAIEKMRQVREKLWEEKFAART
ncbi:MAG: hypothetical protein KKE55_02875 [Candidatus Omnitrophica bacterium]|nr:hypothetical protein [Candidatus Omnitrophota bacterium]